LKQEGYQFFFHIMLTRKVLPSIFLVEMMINCLLVSLLSIINRDLMKKVCLLGSGI